MELLPVWPLLHACIYIDPRVLVPGYNLPTKLCVLIQIDSIIAPLAVISRLIA